LPRARAGPAFPSGHPIFSLRCRGGSVRAANPRHVDAAQRPYLPAGILAIGHLQDVLRPFGRHGADKTVAGELPDNILDRRGFRMQCRRTLWAPDSEQRRKVTVEFRRAVVSQRQRVVVFLVRVQP
jgi:hypothetical protein